MQVLNTILGFASDPDMASRLHDLSHAGKVEYITISHAETARRRFRVATDRGTDCAIALGREARLADGAVLKLDASGAIVVRLTEQQWLAVEPADAAAALELGYFAGNLHWRVRFDGGTLLIALEGPRETYVERLAPFFEAGRAKPGGDNG